jgi:response regulator RpfG family c-di-GMP phosphodiesterase
MDTLAWDSVKRGSSGSIFRIAPSELKLGHKVIGLDCAWDDTPWRGPTLVVEDFETRSYLKENCEWVIVDLQTGTNRFRPSAWRLEPLCEPLPNMPEKVEALQRSPLTAQTLKSGAILYAELHKSVRVFGLDFQRTGELGADAALTIVQRLASTIGESMAALVWLSRIKDPRLYVSQHIINSAILMGAFVHALGWPKERLETALMVGLFHDIGKLRINRDLLFKAGALDEEERKTAQSHPTLAADLLRQNPQIQWEVIAGVAASHERPDGAGYPRGLKGDFIPVMARLVAIVDAYDAMTSPRTHGRVMTHQQALGVLWKERDAQFDASVVERFIRFLGWVTPGTLVKLSDKRLAVVMEMQHEGGVRPVVRPLTKTAEGLRMGGELVLKPQVGAGGNEALSIVEMLPDGSADIDSRELTEQLFAVLGEDPLELPHGDTSVTPLHEGASTDAIQSQTAPSKSHTAVAQDSSDAELAAPAQTDQRLAEGLRVLVIDDALTVRRTLQRFLENAGAEVVAVDSGEAGLREVKHAVPDLVFLDILLPGISGFSALRKIRQLAQDQYIPVVMISGNPQATQHFFLKRIGADDFLPKPFGRDDVTGCLMRLRKQQKLR